MTEYDDPDLVHGQGFESGGVEVEDLLDETDEEDVDQGNVDAAATRTNRMKATSHKVCNCPS